MNAAKRKLVDISAMACRIDPTNRRAVIDLEIRPALESLRTESGKFDLDLRSFSNQVDTLGIWATQIWKRKDGHLTVGKFIAELSKLEARLKEG